MSDRELTDALLEVVRERMTERDLTHQQLADRAGMPQPTLSRKLRGLGDFTVDEVDALAKLLGEPGAEELLAFARSKM